VIKPQKPVVFVGVAVVPVRGMYFKIYVILFCYCFDIYSDIAQNN
jgi:hypothetical protein